MPAVTPAELLDGSGTSEIVTANRREIEAYFAARGYGPIKKHRKYDKRNEYFRPR